MDARTGRFYETLPTMALEAILFLAQVDKQLIRVSREFLSSKAGHLRGDHWWPVIPARSMATTCGTFRPSLLYGSTAKVRFLPAPDTPYTGLFREKALGLGRFSYAGPVLGIGVVPAFGLKLLVDGNHPSENLVVMRMLDSQQSHLPFTQHRHSVFQNPFTNILPRPHATNLVMQVVKERFETVVEKGTDLHQPVNNLAEVRGNGAAEAKAVAPYRIMFSPTAQARQLSNPEIDFRDDLAQNVPAGTLARAGDQGL